MGQWATICPACCPSVPFLVFQQAINYVPRIGLALRVPHLTFRTLSPSSAVTGKAADFSMYYLVNKAFLSARLLCTSGPDADGLNGLMSRCTLNIWLRSSEVCAHNVETCWQMWWRFMCSTMPSMVITLTYGKCPTCQVFLQAFCMLYHRSPQRHHWATKKLWQLFKTLQLRLKPGFFKRGSKIQELHYPEIFLLNKPKI